MIRENLGFSAGGSLKNHAIIKEIMAFSNISGETRAKKIILGAYKSGRLNNAYLFSGKNLQNMADFAREFAKILNCSDVCGQCLNCTKIKGDVHPDFITVVPEGKKGIIKIDRIREIKGRIKYGPSEGTWLVVRIVGADAVESAAANSFLKILEEPPERVLFILITSRQDNIPKTVISRCQAVVFTNEDTQDDEKVETPIRSGSLLFKNSQINDIFKFSASLSGSSGDTDRENVEKGLTSVLNLYWNKKLLRETKIVLQAIKSIRKMANIRLAVDYMALRLGGVLNG